MGPFSASNVFTIVVIVWLLLELLRGRATRAQLQDALARSNAAITSNTQVFIAARQTMEEALNESQRGIADARLAVATAQTEIVTERTAKEAVAHVRDQWKTIAEDWRGEAMKQLALASETNASYTKALLALKPPTYEHLDLEDPLSVGEADRVTLEARRSSDAARQAMSVHGESVAPLARAEALEDEDDAEFDEIFN